MPLTRFLKEGHKMKRVASILTTLALFTVASLVLVSATTASPVAGTQRITMESSSTLQQRGSSGAFVLTPVGSGPLQPDAGTFTSSISQKKIVRDGQSVYVFKGKSTWKGKLGTLVVQQQFDDVDASRGYRVATGLWSLVSAQGTGQYAGVRASGRAAYVLTPSGHVFFRWEGLAAKS
jgi:hypothetical protein